MSDVRAIVFDWGGVILRICRSFEEGCVAAGLPVRPIPDADAARRRRRAVAERFQRGEISFDAFCVAMAEAVGGAYAPSEIAQIHDAWLIAEYDGVADVIAALRRCEGVATALLSNTNDRHWALGSGGGKSPSVALLEHRFASHLLGVCKPDAEAFARVERALGIEGSRVLFFDDLEENVAAARAVGWRAERIDPEAPSTAPQIVRALCRAGLLQANGTLAPSGSSLRSASSSVSGFLQNAKRT